MSPAVPKLVALLSIVLGVGCSKLRDGPDYRRQRKAIEQMSRLRHAIEAVYDGCGAYPGIAAVELSSATATGKQMLQALSKFSGIEGLSGQDGWDRPISYYSGPTIGVRPSSLDPTHANGTRCRALFGDTWSDGYVLRSLGRNGIEDCTVPVRDPSALRVYLQTSISGHCSSCERFGAREFECDLNRTERFSPYEAAPEGGVLGH